MTTLLCEERSPAIPTVDIIVPAYNAARYLAEALDSVMAQTFSDWRILLVNDGSTDDTAEIAARYQVLLGDKMVVITQPNAGLPAARNAAIRASSAEFLAILDADDIWLPCRLAASLGELRAHSEAGLSYGLITFVDAESRRLETFNGNPRHAAGRIAPYLYMRTVDLPCPTITFRRTCMEKVGLFDETMRATEDRDFWFRIAVHSEVAFIPKVIALYRRSANSMSTDMDRMLASQMQFLNKHYGAPGCGWFRRQFAIARLYQQRGEIFRERGQWRNALRSALRACFFWPFSLNNIRTTASLLLRRGPGRPAHLT